MQLMLVAVFLVVLVSAFLLLGRWIGREIGKLELLASKGREFRATTDPDRGERIPARLL